MSTPQGPKTPGAPTNEAAARPSLDQTFLGVSPALRPPANVVPTAPAPPTQPPSPPSLHPSAAVGVTPSAQLPLMPDAAVSNAAVSAGVSPPPPTPSRNAIVAAPMISVSGRANAAPVTPRVAEPPVAPAPAPITPRVISPGIAPQHAGFSPQVSVSAPSPGSEQTLLHPTPRTDSSSRVGTAPAAAPQPARSAFPKPEAYAVPPRASDASRALAGADRTSLSADYLRAAREAALGKFSSASGDGRGHELGRTPPASGRILQTRPAFAVSAPAPEPHSGHDDAGPASFATQQSVGSEPPPPRAGAQAFGASNSARRSPPFGTVLEAPRGLGAAPPLPELPAIVGSENDRSAGAHVGSAFEPVPAARTHVSDRGASGVSGHSLGHISVDWTPDLAERARGAMHATRSKSPAMRAVLIGVTALVLIALGFVTLGGPLRRFVARVARRAITTEVETATPATAPPAQTTLANRPATTEPTATPPSDAPKTAPVTSTPAPNP